MFNEVMKSQVSLILLFIPSKQNYISILSSPLSLISLLDSHSTKILLSFLATLGTTMLKIPFFRLALTAS